MMNDTEQKPLLCIDNDEKKTQYGTSKKKRNGKEECRNIASNTDANHAEVDAQYGHNGVSAKAIHSSSAATSAPLAHSGTVKFWGSIAIAINTLTGPGMLELPATFQRSGFIPTSLCILFVAFLCSMCALNFANVISKVRGNNNFQQEIEYSDIFYYFWGRKWYLITQFAFMVCILSQLVASIVDVAQVVDTYMGSTFANASSIQFRPTHHNSSFAFVHWNLNDACNLTSNSNATSNINGSGSPKATCVAFNRDSDAGILLTSGYVLCMIIFLPMGLMNLKENVLSQVVAFIALLVFSLQFAIGFWSDYTQQQSSSDESHDDNLSLWGHGWTGLFGIVLFNFNVVTVVPAWLYEKEASISVPQVIHWSNIASAALYIIVGGLGALSMPHVDDNMLSSMIAGADGPALQIGASLFAFFIIGVSIPLFSVLLRLNLTGSGLCSHWMGNVVAVWIPWGISWLLYQGEAVQDLLAWGGAIFTSFVAFIAPLLLELHANYTSPSPGSVSVFSGIIKTREREFWALLILLLATIISVGLAIFGLAFQGARTHSDIHAMPILPSST